LIAISPVCPTSSVCPSGAAEATAFEPIAPVAPGRFSTTTGCPSEVASRSASTRATMSPVPPAENGTTSRTVRVGYCCAYAGSASAPDATTKTAAKRRSAGIVSSP
jgi:hypothetical protein